MTKKSPGRSPSPSPDPNQATEEEEELSAGGRRAGPTPLQRAVLAGDAAAVARLLPLTLTLTRAQDEAARKVEEAEERLQLHAARQRRHVLRA